MCAAFSPFSCVPILYMSSSTPTLPFTTNHWADPLQNCVRGRRRRSRFIWLFYEDLQERIAYVLQSGLIDDNHNQKSLVQVVYSSSSPKIKASHTREVFLALSLFGGERQAPTFTAPPSVRPPSLSLQDPKLAPLNADHVSRFV